MRPSLSAAFVAVILTAAAGATITKLGAQTAGSEPAFEAASVKANKSGDNLVRIQIQPGGRFVATGVTVRMIIGIAYGAPQALPDSRIIGGPSWLGADRFDINATPGAPQPATAGPPSQIGLMIRALLKERFKLVTHTETRELPIYALALTRADGKLGPQLHASTVDCAALRGRGVLPPPTPGDRLVCGVQRGPGILSGGNVTMLQLAGMLSQFADRNVIDRTGLAGNYDVDLHWTPERLPQPPAGGLPPGVPPPLPIDPNGPSLFTALQEQLGLKLDPQRGPVEVVVIDGAEHPIED